MHKDNPFLVFLKRAALHAKDMPDHLRSVILDSTDESALLGHLCHSIDTKALIQTTTAVDVIEGGDKCPSMHPPSLHR